MTIAPSALEADGMFSQIMGHPAYKVTLSRNLLEADTTQQNQALALLQQGPVFAYAKIEPTDLPALRWLYQHGFDLVDTSTVFDKALEPNLPLTGQSEIRFATPADAKQTIEVARHSFQYSRFHQDPRIERHIADEIKAVWVGNYFSGQRGQAMVLGLVNGQVAGFLQLLYKGDTLVIDLIAVGRDYRRMSIGRDMIAFAQTYCPPHPRMLVSTQLANIPSMRLYEAMGFRFHSAQHVLHYHAS
jgi:ribosomal protein S18 acetylase RimI-like enzyme